MREDKSNTLNRESYLVQSCIKKVGGRTKTACWSRTRGRTVIDTRPRFGRLSSRSGRA